MSIADGKNVSEVNVKSPRQLEGKAGGVVGRWIAEIGLASKIEREWREEAEGYWQLYRGGGEAGVSVNQNIQRSAFPILWTNTETMRPAIFNSPPKPDVRRRYHDEDKLGKAVSDVQERALEFCIDTGCLYDSMRFTSLDMCISGRGIARVKYSVTTAPMPEQALAPGDAQASDQEDIKTDQAAITEEQKQGGGAAQHEEPDEEHGDGAAALVAQDRPHHIVGEGVEFEHVQWDDFRRGPGRSWAKVDWIAFRHRYDYDELIELVEGGLAPGENLVDEGGVPMSVEAMVDQIPLDSTGRKSDSRQARGEEQSVYQAAECWEIWDRKTRKILWVCEGYRKSTLRTDNDPLKLRHFYPTPRPAHLIEDSASLIPTPVYRMYRDQARELELICKRIDRITDAMRIRGLYHPGLPEVEQVLEAGDNEMIPVTNTSTLAQMKSLDDAIWLMPLEPLANILQRLYTARQETIQMIYQITGISDIMRGDTKASETLGAQEIKSQWGTVRLQRLQSEVARYSRDLICLAAEVICTRFQPQTLISMTGLKMPHMQDVQQAQAFMQQMQQKMQQLQTAGGDPATAQQKMSPQEHQQMQQAQQLLGPDVITWDAVFSVMHSDMLMQYKVDIESESTVSETINSDMMGLQQVLTGVSQFIQAYFPMVQSGVLPMGAFKEMLMAIVRRARLGRAVEDQLDQIGQQQQQPPTEAQIAKLNSVKDTLMQTAKDMGERHDQQSQQLLNQDKAVMGMFQKVQQMTENFTQTAQGMMQQVGAMHSQSEQLAALPGVVSTLLQQINQLHGAIGGMGASPQMQGSAGQINLAG